MEAYCKVNWPLSILAWGSELRFSRRRISLTWLLTSAKADSVWRAGQSGCRLELWEIYSEICSEIYKPARHQPMHRASGHPAVLFVLSESYRLLSQKDSWLCVKEDFPSVGGSCPGGVVFNDNGELFCVRGVSGSAACLTSSVFQSRGVSLESPKAA